jgi:hypothetical protein
MFSQESFALRTAFTLLMRSCRHTRQPSFRLLVRGVLRLKDESILRPAPEINENKTSIDQTIESTDSASHQAVLMLFSHSCGIACMQFPLQKGDHASTTFFAITPQRKSSPRRPERGISVSVFDCYLHRKLEVHPGDGQSAP